MDASSTDPVTIGAIAAAGLALANGMSGIIKVLVEKLLKKDKPVRDHLEAGSRVEKKIDRLVEWHDAKDANGVPFGYFPRSMVEEQRRIAELQHETAEINRRILDRLDVHDENMERGFQEIRRDVSRIGK